MDLGLFLTPSHPPEGGCLEGHVRGLEVTPAADELGYQDTRVGVASLDHLGAAGRRRW